MMRVAISILLLLPFALRAAPVADAGANQTVAQFTPVLLDGSATTGALLYQWEQVGTSPAVANVLTSDFRAPYGRVWGLDTVGAYTFRLTVSDGTETDSDEMTVTVQAPAFSVTNFVDLMLSTNITDGRYDPATRSGSADVGTAYNAWTNGHFATFGGAGELVAIREGAYKTTNPIAGTEVEWMRVTRSGTATAPIRIQNYNGESVLILGMGYDTNVSEGLEIGKAYPTDRERLLYVLTNDYIQITGLTFAGSQDNAVVVERGSFNAVWNCVARSNWFNAFVQSCNRTNAPAIAQVNDWWHLEAHHNPHGYGGIMTSDQGERVEHLHTVWAESYFWRNGFHSDDRLVGPTSGDATGGGNSDGWGMSKNAADPTQENTDLINLYRYNIARRLMCFGNADDGIDISGFVRLSECIMGTNGPSGDKGLKMFSSLPWAWIEGNLTIQNQNAGYELRFATNSASSNQSHGYIWHNTAIANGTEGSGAGFIISGAPTTLSASNNLSIDNASADFSSIASQASWQTSDGDPEIVNRGVEIHDFYAVPAGTPAERVAWVRAYYEEALKPVSGSPLIDAGAAVPFYGRAFHGAAPDIGAFEFTPPYVLRVNRLRATTITIP